MIRLMDRPWTAKVLVFFLLPGLLAVGCTSYVARSEGPSFDRVMTGEVKRIDASLGQIQRRLKSQMPHGMEEELQVIEKQWPSIRQEMAWRAAKCCDPAVLDRSAAFEKGLTRMKAAAGSEDYEELERATGQARGAFAKVKGDLAVVDVDWSRLWWSVGTLLVSWIALTILVSRLARWRDHQIHIGASSTRTDRR